MSAGSRIMIVEDDEIIADLISLMLEKKGYLTTATISSGEVALLKSAEMNPDLVLMDINLNGMMDGITAARYIFSLFHIPVVFLTGLYDERLLERAKASESYGYIMKPFTENTLISNIEIALHNNTIHKQFLEKFGIGDPKKIVVMAEAMIIADMKGRVIFFNPSACRLLDLAENNLMMKPFRNAVQLINGETREQVKDIVADVIRQKPVVSHEGTTILVTKSATQKPVSVDVRPLHDDQNHIIGVSILIKEMAPAERQIKRGI
jgi:PAS domain S-box-containing protein